MSYCALCHVSPPGPEDFLCTPCRAKATLSMDEVPDPVEQALNAHAPVLFLSTSNRTVCRCGMELEGGPGYHRRHVAVVIYETLGIEGPLPWIMGPESPSRDHPVMRHG